MQNIKCVTFCMNSCQVLAAREEELKSVWESRIEELVSLCLIGHGHKHCCHSTLKNQISASLYDLPGGESFAGRQQGSGTQPGAGGSNCQAAPQEEGGGENGGGERQVSRKKRDAMPVYHCRKFSKNLVRHFNQIGANNQPCIQMVTILQFEERNLFIHNTLSFCNYWCKKITPVPCSLFELNFSGLKDRKEGWGKRPQPLQPAMRLSSVSWVSTWQGAMLLWTKYLLLYDNTVMLNSGSKFYNISVWTLDLRSRRTRSSSWDTSWQS